MDKILELLETQGPLTGKMLIEKTKLDGFNLWKICNSSEKIIKKTIGKRYVRLDQQVDGYARLSPSIIREFYGYTIIGTEKNMKEIAKKADLLHQEIIEISNKKFKLAQEVIKKICDSQENSHIIKKCACFIIAGDVAYGMSHLEPRPESSTGELVKGSDLDIVVVTQGLPASIIKCLDLSIYNQKNFLLKNPSYKEEIDYIIKDIFKVERQLNFDNFEAMVASKILFEGKFLYGDMGIFNKIKEMLFNKGIPEKLEALEEKALMNRNNAISYLLKFKGTLSDQESMKLFYTKEEKEEFF
ncbi:MAG: hypothetical protein ACOX86_00075 [Pelotomaculaceae bacterium]|jgi:hypothetical protein|nr:hypothetical protein [Bacillota bacterium]HHU86853.1 hypothetical protein [Peptococcaceae bacterium]